MRVLVTGSAGHVGGAIVGRLLRAGHEVLALSRQTTDHLPKAAQQYALTLGGDAFFEQARDLPPCGAVVHAAARIEEGDDSEALSRANCLGTDQVLALARRWGVGRFIFLSSIAVEGLPRTAPMTEEHPLAPQTPYAASKLYGDCAVAASGLSAASLRITSPIGPGLRRRRIFSIFVRNALAGSDIVVGGQGTRRQNYVDVRDVSEAVEQLLGCTATGIYHIAGAESISNLDLATRCVSVLGSASRVSLSGTTEPQEGLAWEISCARAQETFGYVPRYEIAASIRDLGAEYSGLY